MPYFAVKSTWTTICLILIAIEGTPSVFLFPCPASVRRARPSPFPPLRLPFPTFTVAIHGYLRLPLLFKPMYKTFEAIIVRANSLTRPSTIVTTEETIILGFIALAQARTATTTEHDGCRAALLVNVQ